MVVGWTRFVAPPCFWCCFVLNYGVHYTIKFDRCPILNKIHHEDTKGDEVLFYRISGVDGASRKSRCDSLWIKTTLAFVVRAPAGQIRLDPATLSPCEAFFGVY